MTHITTNSQPATAPVADTHTALRQHTQLPGLERPALMQVLAGLGVPQRQLKMRAQQLWHWIYHRGAQSFEEMSNISRALRAQLAEHCSIVRPQVVQALKSVDGTRKWLLRLPADEHGQQHEVEMVFIPEEDRGTLCISSQVGCTLNCRFCHTGTQGWVRNLSAGEIIAQVLLAKDDLGDWPALLEKHPNPPLAGRYITNIVFMGMGEPLYNSENVFAAVRILADGEGLAISRRRITVSTAGVVPEIPRLGEETGAMLAISLHATTDEVRNELVPLNRKYPIAELLDACRAYPGLSNAKRITFEYVMLKGVNDADADARRLVKMLRDIPAKVNLIPFNPWPGSAYACSDWERIERFAEIVNDGGLAAPVRTPRGRDILAACGQLKSESQRLRAKQRKTPARQGSTA